MPSNSSQTQLSSTASITLEPSLSAPVRAHLRTFLKPFSPLGHISGRYVSPQFKAQCCFSPPHFCGECALLVSLEAIWVVFCERPVAICSFSPWAVDFVLTVGVALTFKETHPLPYVLQIFFQVFFISWDFNIIYS